MGIAGTSPPRVAFVRTYISASAQPVEAAGLGVSSRTAGPSMIQNGEGSIAVRLVHQRLEAA
jgi:hypothetical protein